MIKYKKQIKMIKYKTNKNVPPKIFLFGKVKLYYRINLIN